MLLSSSISWLLISYLCWYRACFEIVYRFGFGSKDEDECFCKPVVFRMPDFLGSYDPMGVLSALSSLSVKSLTTVDLMLCFFFLSNVCLWLILLKAESSPSREVIVENVFWREEAKISSRYTWTFGENSILIYWWLRPLCLPKSISMG